MADPVIEIEVTSVDPVFDEGE